MSDAPHSTEAIVPIKVPAPEGHAPPSLAQPTSGPTAEMSGALHKDEAVPAPQPSPATVPSNTEEKPSAETTMLNGAPETVQPETAKSVEELSTKVVAPTVPDEPPSERPPVDQDAEMKDAAPDVPANTDTALADEPAEASANGAATGKAKRKSTSGVPEHKSKTLKKKQSKAKMTHLDAKPGEYYLARLKSYPPWPSVICDEEMLPDILLKTRPKTAAKPDGFYNEAYADGGSLVAQRSFPVMFLHTNEFGWIPNTDLSPLTADDAKAVSEKSKSKHLVEAFKVAAEGHDLQHYKEMLMAHDAAMQEEEARKEAAAAAAKQEKKEKKKRKSEVKVDDDVEMEDVEGEPKKASKKRKKDAADSDDDESEKPAKTPKTTKLKLTTGKTPSTDKKSDKKATKPKGEKKKKKSDDDDEDTNEEAPPVDPVKAREDREREVLFLRHKLQKGFLSRDQVPSEDEMPQMATYIKKLEAYGTSLDVQTIRATKINKVLKGIIKLNSIPKDSEFHFKERSTKLLGEWNQILGAEPAEAEKSNKDDKASPTTTNGVHQVKSEEKPTENQEHKVETPADMPEQKTESIQPSIEQPSAPSDDKSVRVDQSKPTEEAKPEDQKVPLSAPAAEPEPEPTPAVLDKAPESAAAATEVADVVKATE